MLQAFKKLHVPHVYQQNPSGKTNDGIRWKIRTYWQTLGISIANCQCLQKKLPKTIFELLHQRHAAVDLRSCGVATFDGWRDQAQLELWTSELGGTSGLEWSWNFWNSNGFSKMFEDNFPFKTFGVPCFSGCGFILGSSSPSGWSSVSISSHFLWFCGSSTRYLESSWEAMLNFPDTTSEN